MPVPEVTTPDSPDENQPVEGVQVIVRGDVPLRVEQLRSGYFTLILGEQAFDLAPEDAKAIGRVLMFDRPRAS